MFRIWKEDRKGGKKKMKIVICLRNTISEKFYKMQLNHSITIPSAFDILVVFIRHSSRTQEGREWNLDVWCTRVKAFLKQ